MIDLELESLAVAKLLSGHHGEWGVCGWECLGSGLGPPITSFG